MLTKLHTSPDGSYFGVHSKNINLGCTTRIREITPQCAKCISSCNKYYLPWFSWFKFRNKICKGSWTRLCGDRPWIFVIRLTTPITAGLWPPIRIRATHSRPGTVPQQSKLPFHANIQNCKKLCFVMSVRLKHVLPRDRFHKIRYEDLKNLSQKWCFITLQQEWWVLYMKTCVHLWRNLAEFLQWHISDKICWENQNTSYVE